MRVFIGGVRGSNQVVGGACEEFGGDTTCIGVVSEVGDGIVLDAGSGFGATVGELAALGQHQVPVFLTHYHLDHLVGLCTCPQLYSPQWCFHFYGPVSGKRSVREVISTLLDEPFWPVSCAEMPAGIEFHDLGRESVAVGDVRISHCPIAHPNGAVAYRVDEIQAGGSMVLATDLEWHASSVSQRHAFLDFCRNPAPVDLLLFDAQIDPSSADEYRGWGHSSWHEAVEVAGEIGASQLLAIHHDPALADGELGVREMNLAKRRPGAALARAGEWWHAVDGKVTRC